MSQNLAFDDSNHLESLADLEELENVIRVLPRPGPQVSNEPISTLALQGMDRLQDGRFKLDFTQGIELILNPQHACFHGQGLTLRIGSAQMQAQVAENGLQVFVDGVQINIRTPPTKA